MTSRFPFQHSRRSAHVSGFTLVELMVAMTGGLFLSIVVFAVSRDASRFYQSQMRVANATMTGVAGFERLAGDLARAGHMSTPNILNDPRICNRPDNTWPIGIRNLRAVVIETGVNPGLTGTEVVSAGYTPHGIVISGALEATEELYTNAIEPIAGGFTISLNLATPSAWRLGLRTGAGSGAINAPILDAVFRQGTAGRIVRVRKDGLEQYAVVSTTAATDTLASVNLLASPALLFRTNNAANAKCGIGDNGSGYSLSVVNIVRYNIRSMTTSVPYQALFDASGRAQVPFETTRAELTRVELDAFGTELLATLEIVAEYAVNLQVRPWAVTARDNPSLNVAATPAQFGALSTTTQLLRGANVLLSVRSRDVGQGNGGGSNYQQIKLPTTSPEPDMYARVRTFQSDIPFRNLENAYW